MPEMFARYEKAESLAGLSKIEPFDGDRLRQMAERLELDGGAPIRDRILGLNVHSGRRLNVDDEQRLRSAHDRRRREVALLATLWGGV